MATIAITFSHPEITICFRKARSLLGSTLQLRIQEPIE